MRILFITERFPPQIGGVCVSAERLTKLLAERGHEIHVFHIGADTEGASFRSLTQGSIVVHQVANLGTRDLTLQFAECMLAAVHKQVGFNLFHGHSIATCGYFAAYQAKFLGAKSFVSARGNDIDRGAFNSQDLPFVLWALQNADGIGCVSRELVDKCRTLTGRENAQFTPNSVDTTEFVPQEPDAELLASIGWSGEAVLGFSGELRFKKGTLFTLEAFRTVRETLPAKLLLVGGMRGEDKSVLRSYLRQHPSLRPDIHVIDYIQDRRTLVGYYNLMDIVLSPSLWDGMPNSVLEAMSCGRTVLASNAGGIRDVIEHGETGFLIGTHELDRLGEGCLEILNAGPEFWKKMGAAARKYVETNHRPEMEAERLEAIYESLLRSSE